MIRVVAGSRVDHPLEETPSSDEALGQSHWSVDDAFAYCERVVRQSAENFPIASRFVPAALRRYVWSAYAFARYADDFVDEPQYQDRRAAALDYWEEQLMRCFHGDEPRHPVFVALRETVDKRDIPISPLQDLLTAYRIDLNVSRHPTFASLKSYCAHAAEPVGRLVLYIFDYRDPSLMRFTDDLATALQLTKIIQDVPRDYERGRIYLPQEDLTHFGVTEEDIAAGRHGVEMRDMLRFQAARARAFFERGRPIIDKVGRDLSFEMSLIWQGGIAMLEKLEALDYDVFSQRPELDTVDKTRMVLRSAAHRWPERRSQRR